VLVSLKRSLKAAAEAPFRIPIGPARFYLDDVKDIYEALIDFAQQQSAKDSNTNVEIPCVEIRALNATADEVADLKDATRPELDHLSLILSTPKVRVDLWSHQAEIIAESDTSDVRKFVEGIAAFTDTRRKWTAPLRRVATGVLPAYLLLCSFIAIPYLPRSWGLNNTQGINRYNGIAEWFFAVMVVALTIFMYVTRRYIVRVLPVWRQESRGLSQRSRRDIAVALIAATISAAVIAVAGLWAGIFAK